MKIYLAITSVIFGVKTDDVLAHVLVYTGAGLWGMGIFLKFCLKKFVDYELLKADPEIGSHAFQVIPPVHLLTPRGKQIRYASNCIMCFGGVLVIVSAIYIYLLP